MSYRRSTISKHKSLKLISLFSLALAFTSLASHADEQLQNYDITSPEQFNRLAGWEIPSQLDSYSTISSKSLSDFVGMTNTLIPVESETPLTEEEILNFSNGNDDELLTDAQITLDDADNTTKTISNQEMAIAARYGRKRRWYDYFTWKECQDKGHNITMGKNHFAMCQVRPANYAFYEVNPQTGVRKLVGWMFFRVTILGMGMRGEQKMRFAIKLDQFVPHPMYPVIPPNAHLTVRLDCLPSLNGVCDSSDELGREDTLAGWFRNNTYEVTFDTSMSVGGGDETHFDLDHVSYHELQVLLADDSGKWITKTTQPFRCDAAPYADRGACIFHQVQSTLHYKINPPYYVSKPYPEVAIHIKDAQDHPENTDPFRQEGITIPGKPGTTPLTRLYANENYREYQFIGIDISSKQYAKNTESIVQRECANLLISPRDKVGKDCDEYPFKSTYEGAYFTELNENSIQKFSIRYVNRTQNRRAGAILKNWYRADHVIARDKFFVQIDP
jgi:hypothetical protein